MGNVFCLPPVAPMGACVLILGSMPGKESLAKQQYYAHKRNSFWRIMSEIFCFNPELSYESRLEELGKAKVALWDVLESCQRESSLDSDINRHSQVPNDFVNFLNHYTQIHKVFFNGAKAEEVFLRYVAGKLDGRKKDLTLMRLPSTSPAHAAMSFENKLAKWRVVNYLDE